MVQRGGTRKRGKGTIRVIDIMHVAPPWRKQQTNVEERQEEGRGGGGLPVSSPKGLDRRLG